MLPLHSKANLEHHTCLMSMNFTSLVLQVVDGNLSQTCYLMALDSCYKRLFVKFEKSQGKPFSIADADYFVFHSPYNKVVKEAMSRTIKGTLGDQWSDAMCGA